MDELTKDEATRHGNMVDGTETTTFHVPKLELSALNVHDVNEEPGTRGKEPQDTNGLAEQAREASVERLRAAGLLDETGNLVPRRKGGAAVETTEDEKGRVKLHQLLMAK